MSKESCLDRLSKAKANGTIGRFGTIFNANGVNHFYDSGTGQVFKLDEESEIFFALLFDEKVSFYDITKNPGWDFFIETIEKNHLLDLPYFSTIIPEGIKENLKEIIKTKREQLIIKLTDNCNFRCRYCLYNEDYNDAMNFTNKSIDIMTAKKAIDEFLQCSTDNVDITFYGGEPLLEFNKMKELIEYSLNIARKKNKKTNFSFTTNCSLVTCEMAKFFNSIENLSILCSIDGPKDIHDAYRVGVGGQGTFDKSIQGLKILTHYCKNNTIGINAVFAPPYGNDKIGDINSFFNKLDFLPSDTQISIGYPSEGSITEKEYERQKELQKKYNAFNDTLFPLENFDLSGDLGGDKTLKIDSGLRSSLMRINNRARSIFPIQTVSCNACCLPGVRRLYVETDGKYYPCERIGYALDIGNVNIGLDIKKIEKYYLDDFANYYSSKCNNCWAIRLCSLCYVNRVDKNGVLKKEDDTECKEERNVLSYYLSVYHTLLETNPVALSFLEHSEFI